MLNQTIFAKLLNNLKKMSTSNTKERRQGVKQGAWGGATYVIKKSRCQWQAGNHLRPFTAGKVRGTTKQIPQ